MSEERLLRLEILSGPLDGHVVTLREAAEWERGGEGPLSFPWDVELGEPQARFVVREDGWYLEGLEAPHGTYCINREERVTGKRVPLAPGDLLKASGTWLRVKEVGGVPRQAPRQARDVARDDAQEVAPDDVPRKARVPDAMGAPRGGVPPGQGFAAPPSPKEEADTREAALAENQARFEELFGGLAARLGERGIEVEVEERAREFLCDPFWTKTTLEEALANLVEKPLIERLEAGEFEAGDRVLVKRYVDYLEFHKQDAD